MREYEEVEIRPIVSEAEERFDRARKRAGLLAAPIVFAAILSAPLAGLSAQAHRLAAVFAAVIVLWITEAIPLPVTSLVGAAVAAMLGVAPVNEIFASFADPVIFLFIGSFILAQGIFKTGLNRRIAFGVLSRRLVASRPGRVMVACGAISYFLSMWMSSTAVVAFMFPISLSIVSFVGRNIEQRDEARAAFGMAMMFAIMYGALTGGMATPVGTPPNLIALGLIENLLGRKISFVQWLLFGVPISLLIFLFVSVYLWKRCIAGRIGDWEVLSYARREKARLGRMTAGERNVFIAFSLTVVLWIAPGALDLVLGAENAAVAGLQKFFHESVVAVLGACLLFVIPTDLKERRFTLDWRDAEKIDWGTILLFGGGLAMGKLTISTGLGRFLGEALLKIVPIGGSAASVAMALTLFAGIVAVVFTEVMSNTATASMLVPIVISLCQALGADAFVPALVATLCSSLSYMLPVSTPGNAIVYSSGYLPITKFIKYGLLMDLIALALVVLLAPFLLRTVFSL